MSDSFVTQFKAAPLWQRAFLIVGFSVGIFAGAEKAIVSWQGNPEAQAYEDALGPIAEQLDIAQMTGDSTGAVALIDPITQVMNRFNRMPEGDRNKINQSQTRYCVVAAINLSDGISQVIETGRWINRDQYLSALSLCE